MKQDKKYLKQKKRDRKKKQREEFQNMAQEKSQGQAKKVGKRNILLVTLMTIVGAVGVLYLFNS